MIEVVLTAVALAFIAFALWFLTRPPRWTHKVEQAYKEQLAGWLFGLPVHTNPYIRKGEAVVFREPRHLLDDRPDHPPGPWVVMMHPDTFENLLDDRGLIDRTRAKIAELKVKGLIR